MPEFPKPFFKEPSAAEILKADSIRIITGPSLVQKIKDIEKDQAGIILCDLIPKQFDGKDEFDRSRKFMKHGPELKIRRLHSLADAEKEERLPVELRREAFGSLANRAYPGYSTKPFLRPDKRTRRFSLGENCAGTQLYCYASHFNEEIVIKPYDDAKRSGREGAKIAAKIPSRTLGKDPYEFMVYSVPIEDGPEKLALAWHVWTTHSCRKKQWNIRYNFEDAKEDSEQISLCSHEVAAYLAIMEYYKDEQSNALPADMNPFAVPSQQDVDFYKKLCNQCLIIRMDQKAAKDIETALSPTLEGRLSMQKVEKLFGRKPRKLYGADTEILLFGSIYVNNKRKARGFPDEDTFVPKIPLLDYLW